MSKNKTLIKILIFGVLLVAWALSGSVASVRAQSVPTTMPTPNPTNVALEQSMTALQTQVALLNERKDVDKQSLQNDVQILKTDIETELNSTLRIWGIFLAALGISVAGALVWIEIGIKKIKKEFEEKTRHNLDEAFYKADPRNFPVYFPKRNFETEKENLRKLGFKSLRPYEFLAEIERGIVIHHIPGENFDHDEKAKKHMLQELDDLKSFVKENKDKPLAYVIYIKGQPKEVGDFIASVSNVASANMPVTIAGHIYTLARGLID